VSSERAFFSAAITLSKRRNRPKGDIVEALQFLKCTYRNDIIFQEVVVATEEEEELVEMDLEIVTDESDGDKGFTGDQLLVDDEDILGRQLVHVIPS